MSRIITQPAGTSNAQQHYNCTIKKSIELKRIRRFITPEEFMILEQIYPNGECFLWGVMPGKSDYCKDNWADIEKEDLALFAWKKVIHLSAVVTFKLHNKSLAVELWEYDKSGETWEYIYFLRERRYQNISCIDFNEALGYNSNNPIRKFCRLNEEKSRNIFNRFDFESEPILSPVDIEEYKSAIEALNNLNDTDAENKTKRRKEQVYLRHILFKDNNNSTCACCQREFPVSMFVAAHIKKRSQCTTEERLDMNIVMPMCKLGCDELYEQGYFGVVDGSFVCKNRMPSSVAIDEYIVKVEGNSCDYYSGNTKSYFEWHFENS